MRFDIKEGEYTSKIYTLVSIMDFNRNTLYFAFIIY